MNRYFKTYKLLIYLNFARLIEYRTNLFSNIIGSLGWGLFSIVIILLLTSKVSHVAGWSREELLLLVGITTIFTSIFHMFFSPNFNRLTEIIELGNLDNLLIKPLDSQIAVSFWRINYMGIPRIILGIIFTSYMMSILGITLSAQKIILFFVVLFAGLVSFYSIWFIVLTFMIWFPQLSNLKIFLDNLTGFLRYPKEVYQSMHIAIYTFLLPVILIVSTPAKIILNKLNFSDSIALICIAVFLLFISRWFWKFALRHYTSASS